ncbi:hypothetical protein JW752_00910 [Candidatus Peregrinibacteria bacterium]|nr:hypothetical protein [Candidatus Peregrinibacteria bacterium]
MTDDLNGAEALPSFVTESSDAESDIASDQERIRRGLELCHRVVDNNPHLVISYLSILPDSKEVRREVEQILLKIAGVSPKVILDNAEHIKNSPWGNQAIELAQQNTDK